MPRPEKPLDLDLCAAIAALPSLRWLELLGFAATTPAVFPALRNPRLFGMTLGVTGAQTLEHVLGMLTPELELLHWNCSLGTVKRKADELLHFGAHPNLATIILHVPRVEDDAESLEYAVSGVLKQWLPEVGPWLDDPVL